jgi:hypothetical protein
MRLRIGSANLKKPLASPSIKALTIVPSGKGSTVRVNVIGNELDVLDP